MRSSSPNQLNQPAAGPSAGAPRRVRRRVVAGLAAALVVGVLAACGGQPGAAVIVGDSELSVEDIHSATREVLDAHTRLGQPAPSSTDINRAMVERNVVELLFAELAERRGITATPAEVDELISSSLQGRTEQQLADELAVTALMPPSQLRETAEANVVTRNLLDAFGPDQAVANAELEQELRALADEVDIEVNPRFGSWDPELIAVVPPADDLSVPAERLVSPGEQLAD